MKKKELEAQVEELRQELKRKEAAIRTLLQSGVQYKRQFDEVYLFLNRITGLNSGPMWNELQELRKKYEIINHPTFGEMPIRAHAYDGFSAKCTCCGVADE